MGSYVFINHTHTSAGDGRGPQPARMLGPRREGETPLVSDHSCRWGSMGAPCNSRAMTTACTHKHPTGARSCFATSRSPACHHPTPTRTIAKLPAHAARQATGCTVSVKGCPGFSPRRRCQARRSLTLPCPASCGSPALCAPTSAVRKFEGSKLPAFLAAKSRMKTGSKGVLGWGALWVKAFGYLGLLRYAVCHWSRVVKL